MKKLTFALLVFLTLCRCGDQIKNSNPDIQIEEGTDLTQREESPQAATPTKITPSTSPINKDLLGSWVGYFEKDDMGNNRDEAVYVDEGFIWNRENKINISIDEIKDTTVIGHSVVAGNDRPFEGIVKKDSDGSYVFSVKEPGDDRYDGVFDFKIEDGRLFGKWKAYKKIEIQHRKYELEKRQFKYRPATMLERSKEYVDWNKVIEKKERIELEENEFDEWISREFATATDLIYQVNASNEELSKNLVENLKKGDLTIIRNTIYARHGYSFKNRPLRVFFDAQAWYIPIHTNIKNDFTDLEIKNIQLLLKYEKNAAEYYDYFGRG